MVLLKSLSRRKEIPVRTIRSRMEKDPTPRKSRKEIPIHTTRVVLRLEGLLPPPMTNITSMDIMASPFLKPFCIVLIRDAGYY
jgi:hypothetical protein